MFSNKLYDDLLLLQKKYFFSKFQFYIFSKICNFKVGGFRKPTY
jgi:hypothetical protein